MKARRSAQSAGAWSDSGSSSADQQTEEASQPLNPCAPPSTHHHPRVFLDSADAARHEISATANYLLYRAEQHSSVLAKVCRPRLLSIPSGCEPVCLRRPACVEGTNTENESQPLTFWGVWFVVAGAMRFKRPLFRKRAQQWQLSRVRRNNDARKARERPLVHVECRRPQEEAKRFLSKAVRASGLSVRASRFLGRMRESQAAAAPLCLPSPAIVSPTIALRRATAAPPNSARLPREHEKELHEREKLMRKAAQSLASGGSGAAASLAKVCCRNGRVPPPTTLAKYLFHSGVQDEAKKTDAFDVSPPNATKGSQPRRAASIEEQLASSLPHVVPPTPTLRHIVESAASFVCSFSASVTPNRSPHRIKSAASSYSTSQHSIALHSSARLEPPAGMIEDTFPVPLPTPMLDPGRTYPSRRIPRPPCALSEKGGATWGRWIADRNYHEDSLARLKQAASRRQESLSLKRAFLSYHTAKGTFQTPEEMFSEMRSQVARDRVFRAIRDVQERRTEWFSAFRRHIESGSKGDPNAQHILELVGTLVLDTSKDALVPSAFAELISSLSDEELSTVGAQFVLCHAAPTCGMTLIGLRELLEERSIAYVLPGLA